MTDIFVSYAREDRPRAQRLATALEGLGWSVWWDREIPAGKAFDEVIEQAIEAARCIIVLWSDHSVDSDWVREEAEEGKRRGILVPVLIDAEVDIPFGFRRIQAADLVDWDGSITTQPFNDLAKDIASLLGAPPASATTAEKAAYAEGGRVVPGRTDLALSGEEPKRRPFDPHTLLHTFGPLVPAGFQLAEVNRASNVNFLIVWSSIFALTLSGIALAYRCRKQGGLRFAFGLFSAAVYPAFVLTAVILGYGDKKGFYLLMVLALVALTFGLLTGSTVRQAVSS